MTKTSKLMLAGLGMIVVVFVLFVWHGAGQPECRGDAVPQPIECQPGGGIQRVGAMMSGFSGGVKLPQSRYVVFPNSSTDVVIPANGDAVRFLKLRFSGGTSAQVAFENTRSDRNADPEGIARQRVPARNVLPRVDEDGGTKRGITFVVTDLGGRLTMWCTGPSRCVFDEGE